MPATKARQALLDTKEAAEYLDLSPNTLACWRSRQEKNRPRFIRVGRRIKYRISDLDAYLKANTVTP